MKLANNLIGLLLNLILVNCIEDKYKTLYPILTNEILSEKNELCKNNSELLGKSLRNNTLWAFRMWDASEKDVVGILAGNVYQFGHYDQCVSVTVPIKAKYCLVNIKINKNYTISNPYLLEFDPYGSVFEKLQPTKDPYKIKRNVAHIGICIPDSCTAQDVQIYLQNYLNNNFNNENITYSISVEENDCKNNDESYKINSSDIIFCVIVINIASIVVICTYLDYVNSKKREDGTCKKTKLIACLSLIKNYKELNKPECNLALNVMSGVRFILMASIIMSHTLIVALSGAVHNFEPVEKANRDILSLFICRADVVVDVFFLFGGLLVTYSYLMQSENQIESPIKSIILRYFRMMPVFVLMTFFYATVYYKFGKGPLWNQIVGTESENCQINWWSNILLINNYIDVDHLCIPQGWYLPCDFHFFIFAIPINYLILKKEKFGLIVLGICVNIAVLIPFMITYVGKLDPFFYMFNDFFRTLRQNHVFQTIYVPSHTRASPYLIGMFFGYLYYKIQTTKFEIDVVKAKVLWFFAGIICLGSVGGVAFYNPYRNYFPLEAAAYSALHRPLFAICAGTILLVIGYSSFSLPRNFLTWYPFVPLGKLSFSAYMSHMVYQYARIGSAKTPSTINLVTWFSNTLLDVFCAVTTSFILFLFIENPSIRLIKELLYSDKHRKNNTLSTKVLSNS